jgi:phosphoglycerate dehydrogenase-like enzyme
VTALETGQIAAATLDVTDPEPLPPDDPLWSTRNTIITPHISGGSSAYLSRSFEILELNLARLEKGERVLNEISKKKGY